ncbi:MAG: hypothetical protein AAB656_01190 [Patescibacteria group bacterium]
MATWFLKFSSYKKPNDIFDFLRSGKKTIETRPYNPNKQNNYSKVALGDLIIFESTDTGEKIEKVVTFVHLYDSIEKMVLNEPVNEILPGVGSPEKLIKVYDELKDRWGKDYRDELEKYGIVAIGIKQ